jgi:hypothetical protein
MGRQHEDADASFGALPMMKRQAQGVIESDPDLEASRGLLIDQSKPPPTIACVDAVLSFTHVALL